MRNQIFVLLFLIIPIGIIAQKKRNTTNEIRKINGADYEVLRGLAEIIAIQKIRIADESPLGYDEYAVHFIFLPMEGDTLTEVVKKSKLQFTLNYKSSQVALGPAYLQQMKLKVGTKYAMEFCQAVRQDANLVPFYYTSKALENDLFKAYEAVIDGLGLVLGLFSDSILVDEKLLSDVEQRALIDAKLKTSDAIGNYVDFKFTQTALSYLHKHKALLLEYEAALGYLVALEEEKEAQKRVKELLQKEEEERLQNKVDAIKKTIVKTVATASKIYRGCYYEMIPGLAEVTSIQKTKEAAQSKWNYDEHQVLFKFVPMEGHQLLEKLKDTELEFLLYHRGEKIPVGPQYLAQKEVRVGNSYSMILYQKREESVCTDQYSYESKGLDNDLFEAIPPKVIIIKNDTTTQDAAYTSLDIVIDSSSSLDIKPKKRSQALKEARQKAKLVKQQEKKSSKIELGELIQVDSVVLAAQESSPQVKEPTYVTRAQAIKNAKVKAKAMRKKEL